jgi:hypothetical protein
MSDLLPQSAAADEPSGPSQRERTLPRDVAIALGFDPEEIDDLEAASRMSDEEGAAYLVYRKQEREAQARALRRRELYDAGLISDWR